MATSKVAAAAEQFRQLPSVKLLTDQIEHARFEIALRWDASSATDEYPMLWLLSSTVRAQARHTLRVNPAEAAASDFDRRWADMDRRTGDPLRRGWSLTTREAAERFELLTEYLYRAGELNVGAADADAPERYLSDEEKDGK